LDSSDNQYVIPFLTAISNINITIKSTSKEIFVWVVDYRTQTSLANEEVTFYTPLADVPGTAVTDADGMAVFSIDRKTKEIGIRRVAGAKVSEILILLNKEFIPWVAVAFLIATPLSWFLMNKWLQNFAYKTELSWWRFGLAGLIALGIALLTVNWQSWRAATRNPVEALRYE
jgi:hypothetical protein